VAIFENEKSHLCLTAVANRQNIMILNNKFEVLEQIDDYMTEGCELDKLSFY